jgi:peptide/nickel transport system substrate-binding protein
MQGAEPENRRLEIRLLGPVEVTLSERPLALGRRKQRALLALLALNANRVVSTDRLIDALWGERPPPTAPVALYGLISGLRKLLEPEQAGMLVTKEPGYVLQLSAGQIDLGRFELLAAEGRSALAADDSETASARLAEALQLWRGPALEDLAFLPFAQTEIGRLEELRLAVLEDRIEADLAEGRNGDLVPELESLVAEHPLRERFRGQLMVALYRAGRQADALAAYRVARSVLVDELGLEPSAELQTIERAILQHDPSLSARMPGGTDEAIARGRDGPAPAPERAPRRRRARWIAAATVPLAAVVAVTIFVLTKSGTEEAVRVPADGVGVMEHGKVVAAGTLGASPSDVAVGAGSVWVTSTDGGTVSRIDPDTGDVRQTIAVGNGASGVAADDHAVWVANSLDGTVSRIDPKTDRVVQTIEVGSAPAAIALAGGIVWVTSEDDQTISRINSRTGVVTARVPVGAAPGALAVGGQSLWVADEKRGVVFRVDPARKAVVDTISVGNDPAGIAVGAGSVWVANNLDGTVSRIDPGRDAVAATIPVGDGPRGIAVGSGGIWVSNEFDGTLALIDPRANAVKRVVRIGERPEGVAAGRGRLFVAVRSTGEAHRGGTLRLVGSPSDDVRSLDTVDFAIAATTIATNDGLVAFRRVGGADGGQLVPDLAVAVPVPTDAGRTYTFRLRSGIRYSNGRLVRPEDVRRALERAIVIARDPGYYGAIVGANACAARPARCDLSRAVATDDRTRTVTFHLRERDPDFLYKLALPYAFAVPADTPARDVGTHPLPATGPYMIAGFKPGGKLTLVRNPRFREWSKAAQPAGYPDRIIFAASKIDAARAVERGSQDYALDGVPPDRLQEVNTEYSSQVHVSPREATTYLFLNTKVPPFDDLRVRRALNYAANRAAGVRISARAIGAEPTCQILPPDFPGFQRYCPYTLGAGAGGEWTAPDLDRARRLVAASGTRGAVVTVWVPDNHQGEGPFAANLLRSVGYRARIKRVSNQTYYDPAAGPLNPRRRAQAGLFSWFADYPAASNYITTFFSCRAPSNWSEFCDRRIETQIERALALQTTEPYLANQLWARLDRAIVERAPVVPLFTLKQADIVSRRVGNFQFHPQWGVLLDQLWVR